MKDHLFRTLLIGYLTFLLTGCNQIVSANGSETPISPSTETAAISETQTIPSAPTQEENMQTEPSLPIPAIPGMQALIEKAKADLAQRLSIAASQINVVEAKEIFWPDSSLGCPQPGNAYSQIVTAGYLIRLKANGSEFEYHANIHNYIFYCENPMPPILETPSGVNP